MKKLSLLFMNMMLIAALTFTTSCGDDEEVEPNAPTMGYAEGSQISGDAEVTPGEEFSVTFQVTKGDANLQTITVQEDGNPLATERFTINQGMEETENPFDIENNGGAYSVTITARDEEGTHSYSLVATDKDGQTSTLSFEITTAPETTALGEEQTATLTYKSSNQTDGENELEAAMLRYAGNTANNEARFDGLNSATFVEVTDASFGSFETHEDLESAFNAGTAADEFLVGADNDFESKVVIASDGTDYVLIEVTGVRFDASNNQADVTYKVKAL